MFQDFRRRTTPATGAPRLAALRSAMDHAGVAAFLVPRADAHQGENVPASADRLAWLTGFTGSAGLAVVTRAEAAIIVDGRYRLQVRDEVDLDLYRILNHPEETPGDWLAEVMAGGQLGFDPWLHTAEEIERLTQTLAPHQIALTRCDNLVDAIWSDRPAPPRAPIAPYPAARAGESAAGKRERIARILTEGDLAAAVLTQPESIAWLLNIRGSDVARTPVALAFAMVFADGRVALYTDPAKCDPACRAHLGTGVSLHPSADFGAGLDALAGRVGIDRARAPVWISDRIAAAGRAEIVWARDPCILPKARKTAAEIAGARDAHLRDAVAMARFLCWCDATLAAGGTTEIDAVRRLEADRRADETLRDISFDTIAGSGPNGAIVHYRVTEASDRRIGAGEVLLVDSGGQYLAGTTDVTRTLAIGPPDPDAIRPFTLVLKGMIAMSRLRWPEGLAGRDLDAVARTALWQRGLDYDHGTGHGIGAYLGVHEGPQGLSRRSAEPLLPGMILSIEPGYYREGAFGIRIENLAVVTAPSVPEGGDRKMLGFETLTLAPIDQRMIETRLLDAQERAWLDAYHARVRDLVGPRVTPEVRAWLNAACAPLAM